MTCCLINLPRVLFICTISEGKRAFVSTRGTSNDLSNVDLLKNSQLCTSQLIQDGKGGAQHIHLSGLFSTVGLQSTNVLNYIKTMKMKNNFTFSLDTQYDATQIWKGKENIVLELIQLSDIFLPNHIELINIAKAYSKEDSEDSEDLESKWTIEKAMIFFMKNCPTTLIICKAGKDGAYYGKGLKGNGNGEGEATNINDSKMTDIDLKMKIKNVKTKMLSEIECIDTCGAGDCFTACFLYKIVPGMWDANENNWYVYIIYPNH